MKKIKMSLSTSSIDAAIREVEAYRKWLKSKSNVLLERLAQEGYQVASANFSKASYDGTNDTHVSVESRGNNVRAVVAVGASVLFIEFGTGVTYPDNHPEGGQHGMRRGGYGQGKGKQTYWGYYGDPGTNGKVRTNGNKSVVITKGNPANMAMYNTVRQMKQKLPALVKEVFG